MVTKKKASESKAKVAKTGRMKLTIRLADGFHSEAEWNPAPEPLTWAFHMLSSFWPMKPDGTDIPLRPDAEPHVVAFDKAVRAYVAAAAEYSRAVETDLGSEDAELLASSANELQATLDDAED